MLKIQKEGQCGKSILREGETAIIEISNSTKSKNVSKQKSVWIRCIREGFLKEGEFKLDGEEERGFGSAEKTREVILEKE